MKLGGISPRTKRSLKVSAAVDANSMPLTGVVFQPFEEVKKEVLDVPVSPLLSLARQKYEDECEAAINEQIKSVSFHLHLLHLLFYFIFFFFFIKVVILSRGVHIINPVNYSLLFNCPFDF